MPGYQGVLQKIDPASGKTVWEVKLTDAPAAISLDPKAGVLTVLDQRAVTRYSLEGKSLGQALLIRDTTLNGQNIYNYSFGADAGGGLWFIARDPPANKTDPWNVRFLSFRPGTAAEVAAAAPAHVLSISHAFWYDMTEETARKIFQKDHPDWKIEIRKTITQQDSQSGTGWDEILTSTMTELMAGRGADIISLTFLPWHNLVDKGLLVDLDSLIAKDKAFDVKALRSNVVEACHYGGVLAGLPTGFSQEIVFANGKALADAKVTIDDSAWTWADFHAAAAKVRTDTNGDGTVDRFALMKTDANQFFGMYVLPNALDRYVDRAGRTARFTDPSFAALLTDTQAFCESNAKDNPYTWESSMDAIMKGAIVFEFQNIQGPSFSTFARGYFHGDVKVCSVPGREGLGDRAYAPSMYGINASSNNSTAAWDYIKVLVSIDFQGSQFLFGLPLNNAALAKRVEEQRNLSESQRRGTMGDGTRSWDVTFAAFTDADLSLMNALTARLHRLQYYDNSFSRLVSGELSRFWSGERSAEDVSRFVQDKVMTWLRE